jgi:hypothetical protein
MNTRDEELLVDTFQLKVAITDTDRYRQMFNNICSGSILDVIQVSESLIGQIQISQ